MRSLILVVLFVSSSVFGFSEDRTPFFPLRVEVVNTDDQSVVTADWGRYCEDGCCKDMPRSEDKKAFQESLQKFVSVLNVSEEDFKKACEGMKREQGRVIYRIQGNLLPEFTFSSFEPDLVNNCNSRVALEVWTLKSKNSNKLNDAVVQMMTDFFVFDERATTTDDVKVRTYGSRSDKGITEKIFFFDVEFNLPKPAVAAEEIYGVEMEVVEIPLIKMVDGKKVTQYITELRPKQKKK